MPHSPAVVRSQSFWLSLLGSLAVVAMAGCAMGTPAPPDAVSFAVSGTVHGGQPPVAGATVQLYDAGNTGNGSAATPMLATPVTTDQNGFFTVNGGYSCNSLTDQVYIVATGGNPGLPAGETNPALVMMTAIGSCSSLSTLGFVTINEVTTAAAAWTLAPFISSYTNIGASATNLAGLTNAFLNAALIVDNSKGIAATLPSNLTTEPGKIYALADAIASCVNSDGGSACTPLFTAATPSGGTAPANTFDAAVDIVKNPGNNVAAVFAAIGAQAPFPTTLTKAPNDWTLSLTVKGGGVNSPESLGVDSQGNIWVADYPGGLSAFNAQGTPLSGSPFGASSLSEDYGLTIDANDNIWVTVLESPNYGSTSGSVVEFSGVSSGGTLGTATPFQNAAMYHPSALAAESNGDIVIADNANSSVNVLDPGTPSYTTYHSPTELSAPLAVAVNSTNGIWVAGNDGVTLLDSSNGYTPELQDCCGPADGVALDSAGNVWVANSSESSGDVDEDTGDGSVTELSSNGTVMQSFLTGGGVYIPSDVVVDAGQTVWLTNLHPQTGASSCSFTELAGSNTANPGSALSPGTGFGLDADLLDPYGLVVDPSGNLWVSNTYNNDLVMFFGMATPTKTPMAALPAAP